MGPGPAVSESGMPVLAAVAAAIVIAATGAWLGIIRRVRKRRAP
jgi:hypothetical protein